MAGRLEESGDERKLSQPRAQRARQRRLVRVGGRGCLIDLVCTAQTRLWRSECSLSSAKTTANRHLLDLEQETLQRWNWRTTTSRNSLPFMFSSCIRQFYSISHFLSTAFPLPVWRFAGVEQYLLRLRALCPEVLR